MQKFAAAIMLAIGASAASLPAKPYTGGELHTLDTFMYGRFVASMKSTQQKGTISSFYLYNLDDGFDKDFFQDTNSINVVPSHDPPLITRMSRESLNNQWGFDFDYTLDDAYHTYEIEWTPEYITYSIDDRVVSRNEQVQGLQEGQNLVLSAVAMSEGSDAGQAINAAEMPFRTEFEYVEIYNYDEGEFSLLFRDEFASINDDRWGKGNNKTWQGTGSTIKENNAYVEDGRLVLKVDLASSYKEEPEEEKKRPEEEKKETEGEEKEEERKEEKKEKKEPKEEEKEEEKKDPEDQKKKDPEEEKKDQKEEKKDPEEERKEDPEERKEDPEERKQDPEEKKRDPEERQDDPEERKEAPEEKPEDEPKKQPEEEDEKSEEEQDKESQYEEDEDEDEESSDESDEQPDFHVLPPPKSESLERAIEKATRVFVQLVRTQLNSFSESMGQHLKQYY